MNRTPASPAAAVRTATVFSGGLVQPLSVTGTTEAKDKVALRAPRLRGSRSRGGGSRDFNLYLETLIDPGTRVKKGDIVATFDRENMLTRLDDMRASLADRRFAVNKLIADLQVTRAAHEQDLDAARAAVERAALDLKTAPVRSEIDQQTMRLTHEEAVARYDALQKETPLLDQAQAAELRAEQLDLGERAKEVERSAANADLMVVRAPFDGLAIVRDIRRGTSERQTIRAGDELRPGQEFMDIVNPNHMLVAARAIQMDVNRIKVGAAAEVRFDAFPDLRLPARVYSVGPLAVASFRSGNWYREVPIALELEKTDPRVIPNLSVRAQIALAAEAEARVVPREAVFRDSPDAQPFAYVWASDGWERRALELGLQNNVAVAVKRGLEAGEVVALDRPPEAS